MDNVNSSPPPASDHDSDYAHLREMHKRYMLIPSVARWLLSGDAPTDIHTVRREKSVMVSISSVSAPRVIPQDTGHIPFPASSDLMFLDHVQDGFAFGHIWGTLQSDSHPYAPLAARVGKSGWDHVQSRKFASDLTIDGTLEIVEYTWFADNRAMVILSRIPYRPDRRIVRLSEVLFFDSVERTDIPPLRPALVLLVHDRSICTACGKEICCCPNATGIDIPTPSSCHIVQESALPDDKPVSRVGLVQSWQDRARIVSRGNKRGLLSIVYSGSFAGNFSQITVRLAYVSRCEDQDAIGYRIQQHLTKLLSRMPPTASTMVEKPSSGHIAIPPFNTAQECGISLMQEASSQSPISFTRKDGNWFDSPRQGIFPSFQEKAASNCDRSKQEYCSSAMQAAKLDSLYETPQGTSCSRKDESDAVAECTTSCKPSREEDALEKETAPGAPEILPHIATTQDARADTQDTFQSSLCGPEKAGTECDCSAEKMQDPALARILNSGRDPVVSDEVEDMSSFMEPSLASSPTGNNNILQPIPNMNPTALIASMARQDQRRVDQMPSTPNPFEGQGPNSARCGISTNLPSSLPPNSSAQMEPALKRPRTDSLLKPEPFGFGLDSGWHSSLEDRDKIPPALSWNGAAGNIDRPLSALSLALSGSRSHSPFALMSTLAKTPSPPVASASGQGFASGKINPAGLDFHNHFDHLSTRSLAEFSKKPNDHANHGPRTTLVGLSGIQKSPAGRSRNPGTAITEGVAGNGVCCDICGISFAKRSNKIRHIQTVHNRVKQFECDLCGTKFGLKADLGRHRFRIHESRAFRCNSCGKSFAEKAQLEHHARVTHEEDSRPWECNTCRMRFGRKSSLTRHEQTVHQQTRFVCRFCKKSYSQKFDAVRHERRVHGIHDKAGSAGIKPLTG